MPHTQERCDPFSLPVVGVHSDLQQPDIDGFIQGHQYQSHRRTPLVKLHYIAPFEVKVVPGECLVHVLQGVFVLRLIK